jgi:hypothetical protein
MKSVIIAGCPDRKQNTITVMGQNISSIIEIQIKPSTLLYDYERKQNHI